MRGKKRILVRLGVVTIVLLQLVCYNCVVKIVLLQLGCYNCVVTIVLLKLISLLGRSSMCK